MKAISLILLSVFVILIASLFPFVDAVADDKTCIIKADAGKVHLIVWDADDEGNKGYRIWRGLIKQGEQKRIESQHGQIRYASTTVIGENEPLSGDRGRWCQNGKIIGVP